MNANGHSVANSVYTIFSPQIHTLSFLRMDFRQGGENARRQNTYIFESNSPHFFKIILHETIQNGNLRIPKGFARKYCISDFLGNQHWMVSLKVPSGDVWDMEMKKCDDNQLCLHRGWPEFVDFYGIKHGDFLVFRYEKRGIFHVLIFNTSATEIKYPMKSSNSNEDQRHIHLEEDQSHRDVKIRMLNKSQNPQSPAKDEVIGTNSTENTTAIEDIHVVGHPENMTKPETSKRCRESDESAGVVDTRIYKGKLIQANRERALERASCFKSMTKNPCFTIVMRPTYVNRTLELPAGVLVEQLKLQNTTLVELHTSARRSWTVKYFCKAYNIQRRSCKLTTGWRGFVQDNKLVEGDVCVFELIIRSPIVFHVTTFRASEDPNGC